MNFQSLQSCAGTPPGSGVRRQRLPAEEERGRQGRAQPRPAQGRGRLHHEDLRRLRADRAAGGGRVPGADRRTGRSERKCKSNFIGLILKFFTWYRFNIGVGHERI